MAHACFTHLERRSLSCSPRGSLSTALNRCAHCAWRAAPPSSSACSRRIAPARCSHTLPSARSGSRSVRAASRTSRTSASPLTRTGSISAW